MMSNATVPAAATGLPSSTRRSLIAGLALGAASGSASATTSFAGSPSDPVFAAIEAWRTAHAMLKNFPLSRRTLENEDESEDEWNAIVDADFEAWKAMGVTVPTTQAGLIALLTALYEQPDFGCESFGYEYAVALETVGRFFGIEIPGDETA